MKRDMWIGDIERRYREENEELRRKEKVFAQAAKPETGNAKKRKRGHEVEEAVTRGEKTRLVVIGDEVEL